MEYSIIRKILLDCFKIDRIDYERTRVLTTAHDNDRSLRLPDGKYYSPLIDTMEDDLAAKGVKCVSIARISSEVKGGLSYGNARSPEGGFARALLLKRAKAFFSRKSYPFSRAEEKIWERILDQTGARRVFGIQPSRELCVVCRRRGIWVADVQHGVIGDSHPWYGERFRAKDPVEYLPDAFLCWDYGSQQVIDKWARAKQGVATRVIGNRWLRRFMQPAPGDRLVGEMVGSFDRDFGESGRPVILVSLSWGDYNIPNGFIAPGLEAAIRKTAQKYRWLIRLHPNQVKGFATHEGARFLKYYESTLKGLAEWEVATRPALPAVLRHIHLNISWMSSVCIEAAQLGVRSALLNPRLRSTEFGDYYEYYRGKGMVELVEEKEETILAWIERNIGRKSPPESYAEFDREYHALLDFLAGQAAPVT